MQLHRGVVAVLAVAVVVATACTSDEPSVATSVAGGVDPGDAAARATTAIDGPSVTSALEADTGGTAEATTLPSGSTSPPISVVEVAEVGTPGLDSDDAFCAAWSRFAGSFQVVSVTAAFGSGDAAQLAALEVVASPTVVDAYDQLLANWPDELADEEDLVADRFLGPFARRLAEARSSLDETGVSDESIAAIETAWLDGLARRDPTTPEFVVDLPDEVWSEVDLAADEFSARRVGFRDDPSLISDVEVPRTLEYLAVSCPDQGTLSGQEVDSP